MDANSSSRPWIPWQKTLIRIEDQVGLRESSSYASQSIDVIDHVESYLRLDLSKSLLLIGLGECIGLFAEQIGIVMSVRTRPPWAPSSV